ncbi:MAG TPA: SDR family oxidoreductase [Acidisoma sp.]|jgi:2-deoxy-D-gluconate 3-dehydrogenase|uniref:SDR family NAD(P)-dependent oxidoreductase n=1 Tax=Acidisoma sp. TaxID=1872115 RepID=UPI002C1A9837|nr:SDR family oxidoreductase [Acidisoma sp.]HTI01747.1 SDR family oxidoreductase [Acidisoma sp.]
MIRRAIVTGAGSGIGAGIATALAQKGIRPVLVGRREDALLRTLETIRGQGFDADPLTWDIGNGDDAEALVDRVETQFGAADTLVHAAGNQFRCPAVEFPVEQWDQILGLHLRAAFLLTQAAGKRMIASGRGGSLLFIGSLTSERLGLPNVVAYAAAKSGLLGLMRTLAVEWAPHSIRSNAILVGFVGTEMTRDVDEQPARKALMARAPIGRLGTPNEIGEAAAYLTSDGASFVTGTCLTIDGGWSIA